MLPHVCLALDHRWHQIVVITKMWHIRCSWLCHWCSYQWQFVISCVLLLCRPTATWNQFVLYDKKCKMLLEVMPSMHLSSNSSQERTMKWVLFSLSSNPLTTKSDQHLISPYNITPESHIKVMRIKEAITSIRLSWLLNKFSLSAPWEI